MGRETKYLTAVGTVSNHNSEQDVENLDAWYRFVKTVNQVAERSEYAELEIMIDAEDGS